MLVLFLKFGKVTKTMDGLCKIIKVPSVKTEKVQECHIMIGHILCSIIENKFFKNSNKH